MMPRWLLVAGIGAVLTGCLGSTVSLDQVRAELLSRMTQNFGKVTTEQIRVTVPVLTPDEDFPGRFKFTALFDYLVPTYKLLSFPTNGGSGRYVVTEKSPANTTVHVSGFASLDQQTGRIIAVRYTGGGFDDVGILMSQIREKTSDVVQISRQKYRDLISPEPAAVQKFRDAVSEIPGVSLEGHL